MARITFTIDNITQEMLLQVAKKLGYQETIPMLEDKTTTLRYGDIKDKNILDFLEEGATAVQADIPENAQDNDEIEVKYSVQKEVENPKTVEQFLQEYFVREFLDTRIKPLILEIETEAKIKEVEELKKQKEEELKKTINIKAELK